MSNDRKNRYLMAQASQDLQEGRTELLSALKRVPVSELHNTDPALFARLTPQQRAELFAKIAQQARASVPTDPFKRRRPKPGGASAARRLWNRLPLTARTQLVGLVTTAILASVSMVALRDEVQLTALVTLPSSLPSNVAYWPRCRRLTLASDGCIYRVTEGLSWNDAARALGQDSHDLMAVNRYLAGRPTLYRGDQLIVWRNRIRMED